jgi:hypothetical protein
MNRSSSLTQDSKFGPPSELIHIGGFEGAGVITLNAELDDESVPDDAPALLLSTSSIPGTDALSPEELEALATQCSVDDIKARLAQKINQPALGAHILHSHRVMLSSMHDAADTSTSARNRRRPRRDVINPEEEASPLVRELQAEIDAVAPRAMKLDIRAAIFMRSSINQDHNALVDLVPIHLLVPLGLLMAT